MSAVVISSSSTEEEFVNNSEKALEILFWIGVRAQQASPKFTLNPTIIEDSISNNEGYPTPMLAINGLRENQFMKYLNETNSYLSSDRQIEITLHNGPRSFVCTGHPQSLYGLNLGLRKIKASADMDQSRTPFSQRKVKFSFRFLPITARFHSSSLTPVTGFVLEDVQKYNLWFESNDLKIPVFGTDSGENKLEFILRSTYLLILFLFKT